MRTAPPRLLETSRFVTHAVAGSEEQHVERKTRLGLFTSPSQKGPVSDQSEPGLYAESAPDVQPWWRVYCNDSREILSALPAGSVDCVVTSPPYYWQRDYGVDGQIGMEPSVQGFVDNIVSVFEGVHHALSPTGVVFLNLGDTYYNAKGRPHGRDTKHTARHLARRQLRAVDGPGLGLPRKSLLGIPWRVALAMSDAGWTLRSEIVWYRRGSMPEPTAIDRPWRNHEHVFLFSKSVRYHFDRSGLNGEEDVWEIEPERRSASRGEHYAPYPEALVHRCLSLGCPEGGTVLDPFAGGGTTLAVAHRLGMNSIGVDLNASFCDVMVRRMGGANEAAPMEDAGSAAQLRTPRSATVSKGEGTPLPKIARKHWS
jgi:DNA modification methylase